MHVCATTGLFASTQHFSFYIGYYKYIVDVGEGGREGLLGVTWAYGRYFPFIERGVPCYNHPNRLGFGIGIGIGLALVFTKFHANRKRFDESTTQIHTIGRCQCPLVGTLFA